MRTRRNARWLRLGRGDFVRNGYRFTIRSRAVVAALSRTGPGHPRHRPRPAAPALDPRSAPGVRLRPRPITADPAWPGLVAAYPRRWTPPELLQVAAEHLADADADIGAYDYARPITYSIELLTGDHLGHHIPGPEHPPLTADEEDPPPRALWARQRCGPGRHQPHR